MKKHSGAALAAMAFLIVGLARSQDAATPATEPEAEQTLADVVKLVLEHNPSLREAQEAIGVFRAQVDEARAARLPQAAGTAAYTRLGPSSAISIPDLGSFSLYPLNNYDVHAGVSQLLYDFHRTRTAIDLSQSQVTVASDRSDLLKRDLEFEAAGLFYSSLFLRDNIRVQDDHIRTLRDHLRVTEKRVAAGAATELDTLNTRVRLAAAESVKLDLENGLEKQMITLRRLTGFAGRAPLRLRGEFARAPIPLDLEALVGLAMTRRLEARAVANQIRSAEIRYGLAAKNDSPTLSAAVRAGAKNGYFPDLNSLKLNFVAALQAEIPIFDGHRTAALKAEAAAGLRALAEQRSAVEEMIRSDVMQAVADVRTSEGKLALVEVDVEQAERARDYAGTRYQAGTITNLDLLDTEDGRSSAELLRLEALYRFALSRLMLDRAVGNAIPD